MTGRPLRQRVHNPRNDRCDCPAGCWCNRTRIGRLVKWWFPAHWFGIRHASTFFDGVTTGESRAWRREQDERGLNQAVAAQPRYVSIVKLGPMRYGMTVRRPDGGMAVHELGRPAKLP